MKEKIKKKIHFNGLQNHVSFGKLWFFRLQIAAWSSQSSFSVPEK